MSRRLLYFILALDLLPATGGVTRTLGAVARATAEDGSALLIGAAFLVGFALWVCFFFALSHPVRAYVLGHELTHALWSVLMGGSFSNLKATANGGSVHVTKTNFVVTLAPYFFPFYAMLLLGALGLASFFVDVRPWQPFWMGALGFTWGFHVTFTISLLLLRQTDVLEFGRLFSYVVIYLLNLLILGAGLVALCPLTFADYGRLIWTDTAAAYRWVWETALLLAGR